MRYLFADCELDTERRELRCDRTIVPVAPQVFDLLDYLIRNRDRVVSKDDLITAIWNGRSVTDAALTTRINVARKAIGDSGDGQRLVKTLPRRGFRFVGSVREVDAPRGAITAEPAIQRPDVASSLPDRPLIAVLPFKNLGAAPEQDYFADGMTEDITTLLSQTRDFIVIARGSMLSYKTASVDMAKVGRELGVRYVIEGSVRTAGNKIRVTAQLIEAATAIRVWGAHFDRELTDLFVVQDDVTSGIVGALHPQLLAAEAHAYRRQPPGSVDAWGLAVRGMMALTSLTKENLDAAADLASRAIEIAPEFGLPHGLRAFALSYRAYSQWGRDWYADAKQASSDINRTIGLQGDDPTALFLAGGASHFMARHRASVGMLERAIELNPNLAMAHGLLAISYASLDRPLDGLAHVETALRLSPRDPMTHLFLAGQALCRFVAGDFQGAIASAEKGIGINPGSADNHFYKAAALAELGQIERAREQIMRGLRFVPRMTLLVIGRAIEGNNSGWARYHAALRKAGLPE
ncbi:winged helix-turn-helix domain-containing protein [Bradyrhizobium diazoefficiens]|nr:winged helix-turn-helix domain-containing protein [Bradyrhizobium diazoefficiens]MBR0847547.1 winged helix-turn-helix domain-containing protein [Bradyrhizobium diazoefficiens]